MADHPSSGRAAKLAAQVADVAEGRLAPDEAILTAVRVNLQGTVAATAAGAIGGAVGAVVAAQALEAGGEEADVAGFPSDPQQALGLTERSVVITGRSGLSGRPKRFRCRVPLDEIEAVRHEPGRLGDTLRITMRSGAEVTYSCVKVDPGAAFARALDEHLMPH